MRASQSDVPPEIPKGSSTPPPVNNNTASDTASGRNEVLQSDDSNAAAPSSTTRNDDGIQPSKRNSGPRSYGPLRTHRSSTQYASGGESNTNIIHDPPPTRDIDEPGGRRGVSFLEKQWIRIRDRVKRMLSRSRTTRPRATQPYLRNTEDTIQVCFRTNRKDEVFVARAVFDTGSERNLMSRTFAEGCGYTFNSADAKDSLSQPGGNVWRSVGELPGRWVVNELIDAESRQLKFPERFMDATFLVSEKYDEPYDVIIGKKTMKKYNMIGSILPLVATGFRKKRTSVDTTASENQRRRQAENAAKIEAHEAAKRKEEEDERKKKEAAQSN